MTGPFAGLVEPGLARIGAAEVLKASRAVQRWRISDLGSELGLPDTLGEAA